MRNVEEVFSAMKENLNQILGNLQDGILLFTARQRAVLVSKPCAAFCPSTDSTILGRHAQQIFDAQHSLGPTLRDAFDTGISIHQRKCSPENGRRIQVSLDFIEDEQIPAHGLEPCLPSMILNPPKRLSPTLSFPAAWLLSAGLLPEWGTKSKTPSMPSSSMWNCSKANSPPPALRPCSRHLEIIESEIRRLDRVVQMLVDFSRPVDLQLSEQDLRSVIGDVLALAREELASHNVNLLSPFPDKPLMVNIDADLIKQAVLNVILNGAQAMPDGGTLRVPLEEAKREQREAASSPSSASPTRARASQKRSARKSSTSTSPPKPAAAALVWP